MENWVIYGLLGGTLFGVANFYLKIVAEKGISKIRVSLYSSIIETLFPLLYLLYVGNFQSFGMLMLFIMAVRIIAATEKGLLKIESLKYIEANVFFPIHSIIQVLLTFFVGMLVFGEYLTIIQSVGIALSIVMVFLLTSKKENQHSSDFKKGIFLLLGANAALLLSSSLNKYVMHIGFDIGTYLLISGIIASLYLFGTRKEAQTFPTGGQKKLEIKIGIIKGVLTVSGFCCILLALREGPFALVQVMHTSSIIIPIILSSIFYHEKLNPQKVVALLLFVVVIYMMSL